MLAGNDDHPLPRGKAGTGEAHQLAQAAANQVAHHGTPDAAGCNESDAGLRGGLVRRGNRRNANNHQLAMDGNAMALEVLKLRRAPEPDRLWEPETHRWERIRMNAGRSAQLEAVASGALRLGVPGVMNLDALRQEALTTALTAAGENRTTTLGLHTGSETELAFAGPLGRLIGAFHIPKVVRSGWKKRRNCSGALWAVNKCVSQSSHPGSEPDYPELSRH